MTIPKLRTAPVHDTHSVAAAIRDIESVINRIIDDGALLPVDWSDLANVPTTIGGYGITDFESLGDVRWAQLVHTHTIAQVDGLQTALDGKAALVHTHTIAQVTGLQTALDAKAPLNGAGTSGTWPINILGNAATADEATVLETSRTIFGAAFNGSANVSGALSDATTGAFSGAVTIGNTIISPGTNTQISTTAAAGQLDLDNKFAVTGGPVRINRNGTVGGTADLFIVYEHGTSTARLIVASGGATTIGGTLAVTGTLTAASITMTGSLVGPVSVRPVGYTTSWGVTTSVASAGLTVTMGTGAAATWLLAGTSGGVFRGGIQVLDGGGTMRVYVGTNYTQLFASAGTQLSLSNLNTVTAVSFVGDLTGNAATATLAATVSAVAWGDVTGTPTTIAGYGITEPIVMGPASSTNDALARFDGTTGKLLQSSSALLTDAGLLGVSEAIIGTGSIFGDTVLGVFGDMDVVGDLVISGAITATGISADTATISDLIGTARIIVGAGSIAGSTVFGVFGDAEFTGTLLVNGVPVGGGTGDVVGPASASDNAVARFDGATGKLLQNSSVFIFDGGILGVSKVIIGTGSIFGSTILGVFGDVDVDGLATFVSARVSGLAGVGTRLLGVDAEGDLVIASTSGDVVGPASANNNSLVRFDGSTGKLIKAGGPILDDSGNLTLAGALSGVTTGAFSSNVTIGGTLGVTGLTTFTGGFKLANAAWLRWRNAANTLDYDVMRVTSGNAVVINAPPSSSIIQQLNGVDAATLDASGLTLRSAGPLTLALVADTDNVTETDNPRLMFSQDAGAVTGHLGYASGTNALELMQNYADTLRFGTSGIVRMTLSASGDASFTGSLAVAGALTSGNHTITGRIAVTSANQSVFTFRDTTTAGNYGAWLKSDGTALAYIGGDGGAAVSGGVGNDFYIAAVAGNLGLTSAAGAVLVAATGGLRVSALAGSGTRIVGADGTGNLVITALGSGDVIGPASAAAGALASFDGTTGKRIMDSGVSVISGNVVRAGGFGIAGGGGSTSLGDSGTIDTSAGTWELTFTAGLITNITQLS